MTNAAIELFDKAVAQDETQLIEFARRIPEILAAFPQAWIETHFLPFLATWIPKNNIRILATVLISLPQLLNAISKKSLAAKVIESLVCGDRPEITEKVSQALKMKADDSGFQLLKTLMESRLDCVRKFVANNLSLAGTDDEKRTLLTSLVYDISFKVRAAAAKSISSLGEELGLQVALTLQADRSARIRALLPVFCATHAFYLVSIAPTLVADHDWSVRASVAKSLVKCEDVEEAFPFALQLMNDPAWHVKLCAIRSMTGILPRIENAEVIEEEEMKKILTKAVRYPYVTLKKASVDCFMAMFVKKPAGTDEWVQTFINDLMTRQTPDMKLYCLEWIAKTQNAHLLASIKDHLFETITALIKSQAWRLRLGVTALLQPLNAMLVDKSVKDNLFALSLNLLNDEATPVRDAAASQITGMAPTVLENNALPAYLAELCKSDTYRKRQAALKIMSHLYQKSGSDQEKAVLISEMQKLQSDSCQNVSLYAQKLLEGLTK